MSQKLAVSGIVYFLVCPVLTFSFSSWAVSIVPENVANFSVDNVRVTKIVVSATEVLHYMFIPSLISLLLYLLPPRSPLSRLQGAGILGSSVMKGMVFKRLVEGQHSSVGR